MVDQSSKARGSVGFVDAVRNQADQYVAQRKGDLAGMLADVARGIRQTGDGLGEQPNIKAIIDSAAAGVDELSASISERSFGDLYADLAAEARRRPLLAAAVASAAGLAVAWLVRSGGARSGTRALVARTAKL